MGDSETKTILPMDAEPAGTLDGMDYSSLESIIKSKIPHGSIRQGSEHLQGHAEHGELESHEVIELQAFSERKEWIVDKIKFLGNMPPIELFAGLDAVRTSADVVPGLPTREELKEWLVEHDKIEKETEAFDSGELKKFKQFTKATAQRNLSPEDTDLIELTLTTIYEFDKLLHLLRGRSENLDLLGVRLTWEEHRRAAWADRRSILVDLRAFLTTRARWSSAVYDITSLQEEASSRRGSIMSTASDASVTSSPGFSRAARFKIAEALSRDAATFASRISALRHGKISAAGKALDRLIDHSRKPVPDELLDEQDKLEDQGINEMENVGKFVMSVVTQWRKADEFFVETAKDQAAAQTLFEEIETAKLSHPLARQDTAYTSRAGAIMKRLSARESPASPASIFPRPTHHLFPDQTITNEEISQQLSSDLSTATTLAKQVERGAQEYHAFFEAVRQVEVLCSSASDLGSLYDSIVSQLQHGVPTPDGDGSPVDLSSDACLDLTRHNGYLALLPSILHELEHADRNAETVLPKARTALLSADQFHMDPTFKANSISIIERLASRKENVRVVRDGVVANVNLLREIRKVWTPATSILRELDIVRNDVGEAMEQRRWRSRTLSSNAALLTPESPMPPLPAAPSPLQFTDRLQHLESRLIQQVISVFNSFSPSLQPDLRNYMARRCDGLSIVLDQVKQMIRLGESINSQASIMADVADQMQGLQVRLEDIKERLEAASDSVLNATTSGDVLPEASATLDSEVVELAGSVQAFVDDLPTRVLFVSTGFSSAQGLHPVKRRFSSGGDLSLESFSHSSSIELPFDLSTVDDAVRTDSNAFALTLMNDVLSMERRVKFLRLARKARDVDIQLASLLDSIHQAFEGLTPLQTSLASSAESSNVLGQLESLMTETEQFSTRHESEITRAFSDIRITIDEMKGMADNQDASFTALCSARNQSLDDAELKYSSWLQDVASLKSQISERQRIEHERISAEQRLREEQERLQKEEAARLERERLEAEEQARRMEEERLADERAALERERMETEERLERERLEAEERVRIERERLEAEEEEARLELERRQAEEQARFEHQRVEAEQLEKLEQGKADARREAEVDRLAAVQLQAEAREQANLLTETPVADIFGLRVARSSVVDELDQESAELQKRIHALRKRLRSLNINGAARPSASADALPSPAQYATLSSGLSAIISEMATLPASVSAQSVDLELRSLKSEVDDSKPMLQRIQKLSLFAQAVQDCDACLSDLLEHIDSYPAPPVGPLASAHASQISLPPEEQLGSRLSYSRDLIDDTSRQFSRIADDVRASSEQKRIMQTWNELESMASDMLDGRKSRPSSIMSNGRSSRASIGGYRSAFQKKTNHFSTLSVGSPAPLRGRPRLTAPTPTRPPTTTRRVVSTTETSQSRASSRMSVASTNRSVSGSFSPATSNSRLFQSTFASRQRTGSLTSPPTKPLPPAKPQPPPRKSMITTRPRAQTGQSSRMASPALSDASSTSRSFAPRSTNSTHSTWSRAPRLSFPNLPRSPMVQSKALQTRKIPYVANPKNKLDVAVGDIVNSLPVDINIQVAEDGWRDQSGKYWIGGEDAKLCFCRILRSQTVMVRVGGGWMELSKFIRTHFSDLFHLLPVHESPPQLGSREEKWFNSSALLEAPEIITTPPQAPRTPEPTGITLFTLSANGRSPQSMKSTSSVNSSPLTPLQFIRRADAAVEAGLRPTTPSRPLGRSPSSLQTSPGRTSVWKP